MEFIAYLASTKPHVVTHLWYSNTCAWLKEIFPQEYEKVRLLTGNRQIGGKTAEQQGKLYPVLLSPSLDAYTITNVREFSSINLLDSGDLSNLLNFKVPSTKKWIVKDLNILKPELHTKFYSTKRGYYKKQFDLYKSQ